MDLPNPGIEPAAPESPELPDGFFITELPKKLLHHTPKMCPFHERKAWDMWEVKWTAKVTELISGGDVSRTEPPGL